MEKIIDICLEYRNTSSLKDSVGHFRNVTQNFSHSLLETGFKYLFKKNEDLLKVLET